MGTATEVATATIHWERNTVKSFEIQYSDTAADGSWKAAYSYSSNDLYDGWHTKVNFESPVTDRYFRIYIKDFSDTGLTENDTAGQNPCLAGLHISEYKKVSCETKNLVGDFISYVFRATLIIPPVLFLIPKL